MSWKMVKSSVIVGKDRIGKVLTISHHFTSHIYVPIIVVIRILIVAALKLIYMSQKQSKSKNKHYVIHLPIICMLTHTNTRRHALGTQHLGWSLCLMERTASLMVELQLKANRGHANTLTLWSTNPTDLHWVTAVTVISPSAPRV